MPDVIVDGEKVVFEGTPPGTLGELRNLLEHALAENGRLLARFLVDGEDYVEEWGGRSTCDCAALAAESVPICEAVIRIARDLTQHVQQANREADELAGQVLRRAWNDVRNDCVAFAESLAHLTARLAGLLDHASDREALQQAIAAISAGLEELMDHVQGADAGRISLTLDGELAPALESAGACLDQLCKAAAA